MDRCNSQILVVNVTNKFELQLEKKLEQIFDAESGLKNCILDMLKIMRHPLSLKIEDKEDIILHRVASSITNVTYICSTLLCKDKIVITFYGKKSNMFFNRGEETKIFDTLSQLNIGPKLLYKFSSGRIQEYYNNFTRCVLSQIKQSDIYKQIMRQLFIFHNVNVPGMKVQNTFHRRIKNWLASARLYCQFNRLLNIDNIESEITSILKLLEDVESPVVLLHGDLHPKHIVINKSNEIKLIDFEYAGYGPRGFDFANFFLEWTYNYTSHDSYHLHTEWFPSESDRKDILNAYLENSGDLLNQSEKLMNESNHYICFSLLLWILWGYIQMELSGDDFDHKQYIVERINQYSYFKKKIYNEDSLPLINS